MPTAISGESASVASRGGDGVRFLLSVVFFARFGGTLSASSLSVSGALESGESSLSIVEGRKPDETEISARRSKV